MRFWSKEYGVINTKKSSSAFLSEMGRRGAEAKKRNAETEKADNDAYWANQHKYHDTRWHPCEGKLDRVPSWTYDDEFDLECSICGKRTEGDF